MESSLWYVIGYYLIGLLQNVTNLEFDHTKPYAKLKQTDVITKISDLNAKITKQEIIIPEQACRQLEWCTKMYLILKQCELKSNDLDFSDLVPLLRENRDGYYDQICTDDSDDSDSDQDRASPRTPDTINDPTDTDCDRPVSSSDESTAL
jgi:hypothetical protein